MNAKGSRDWMVGQDLPWSAVCCGYTLVPRVNEVLVIPDLRQDARCAAVMVRAMPWLPKS